MAEPQRVLVTGTAGFIGSHLVRRLTGDGHAVQVMDKAFGSTTADFPLLERTLALFGPDVIVHLGANCSSQISLREPMADFEDNAVGTFNVAEAARRAGGVPVVFNSTAKVHPGVDGRVPPYGLSKRVGEDYLALYADLFSLPVVINRPSSVYGPGQDASEDGGWFGWFIRASLTGGQITLVGDGTQSRDVLYVDDHVDLLVDQVVNFDLYAGGTYDIGGGPANEVSLNELLVELDYNNVRTAPRLPGDLQRVVNDNELVTAVNGWTPLTHWSEGLKRTLEHYRG